MLFHFVFLVLIITLQIPDVCVRLAGLDLLATVLRPAQHPAQVALPGAEPDVPNQHICQEKHIKDFYQGMVLTFEGDLRVALDHHLADLAHLPPAQHRGPAQGLLSAAYHPHRIMRR